MARQIIPIGSVNNCLRFMLFCIKNFICVNLRETFVCENLREPFFVTCLPVTEFSPTDTGQSVSEQGIDEYLSMESRYMAV